ncbi:hypothetical protein SFRURICE_008698 [Spodoptera frugiperda]|nr:hypothetical protein SFRURICE_008698 [Spodoptera frugiperda]
MSKITPNPAKALLRTEIAARIAALSTEEKNRQSKIVYEKIINHPWYKSAKRISLYMSTDQEINTAPIISHIKERGAKAFVPQYAGGIMRMLLLEENDDEKTILPSGDPSVRLPAYVHYQNDYLTKSLNSLGGLDLVIAPGVAFSKSGDRCGHGGGYYDKFLAGLRSNPATAPKVVAVAFNCQVVDDVPTNEQDQKVDAVIYAD